MSKQKGGTRIAAFGTLSWTKRLFLKTDDLAIQNMTGPHRTFSKSRTCDAPF